jgi:hypothetical protein
MATTSQKIEKALQILNGHDWYWAMANYSNPAYGNAYASMRSFVEVVASIADSAIVKALRELWTATYEYVHATMWSSNAEAKETYKAKEAQLMAVIKPQYAMAA